MGTEDSLKIWVGEKGKGIRKCIVVVRKESQDVKHSVGNVVDHCSNYSVRLVMDLLG